MEIKGKIHSTESFGAADGPGIRYVVFTRGCKLRCKYCHNPDTWAMSGGEEMTADEIVKKALRYKSYWKKDGGLTVSGGEPLLQIDFLIELFKKAKAENINTVIDTAGNPFTKEEPFFSKFNELMNYTDLILVDVKQMNNIRHKELTGFDNDNILEMIEYLSEIEKPIWLRHVLVPGYTDFEDDLEALRDFAKKLKNVQKIEILPYHTLGKFKWEELGVSYPLEDVPVPTDEQINRAKEIISI